ncbi:MAG: alpha,6-mannanase [Herbinix sp.]|nr:alpha,6-mannanase [Herbinix sp.]
MARAYEITGNAEYLDVASDGFDNVYSRAYDPVNGGVFWGFGPDGMGKGHKNSCINYPTIIAALKFYEITGNVDYLNKATDIYNWARTHLFNASTGSVPDLISDQGVVDWTNYTYNQGTMIGAASMLYLATGNISYLNSHGFIIILT